MLTQKNSCASSSSGRIVVASPARYNSATRRQVMRPSAGSGASSTAVESTSLTTSAIGDFSISRVATDWAVVIFTRSTLLAEPDFLGTHLAEQSGWSHDQHGQENQEPDRLLEFRIDVEPRECFDEPDDHAAEVRACHA